ncbi:putative oxidoreductase [Spirosoma lacussanchae]|uniref:DoxX family protein n=1 Tax=Spirosoma lacussanchae TaxID=1884249 RepID=UPI0011089B79|nr:DoxX family protein [Spirosoma lacussanchae]
MVSLFATNPANLTPLIARLALGIVVFPHGAQKLLGWFGGDGFASSMNFLTELAGLPWIVGLLVILIEFLGSLLLILGLATRIAALGILGNFVGIVLTSHLTTGFFMNWGAEANKEEGVEYFILLFGLTLIVLIAGGGKASLDARLTKNAL